ncbi:MAG: GNAT family N-acetyltransferase [Actinomycetota bacterium]|nr:GNAT family N-acetyltransferase [Actinomycetota bacterium]
MSLVVRPYAAGDDARAAGAIVQQAYFALPGYPRDDEYDEVLGAVAQRAAETEVLVGVLDGRLVACLTYVPDQHSPHAEFDDDGAASFRYFGVDPSVQGTGVGEAMVQWCLDRARGDGRARMRIHTLETMPAAQRLYLRMGFERDTDHDEDWDGIKGLAFVYHL